MVCAYYFFLRFIGKVEQWRERRREKERESESHGSVMTD